MTTIPDAAIEALTGALATGTRRGEDAEVYISERSARQLLGLVAEHLTPAPQSDEDRILGKAREFASATGASMDHVLTMLTTAMQSPALAEAQIKRAGISTQPGEGDGRGVRRDHSARCPSWVPTDPNVAHADRERCAERGPHERHRAGLVERYRVEKIHDPDGKHAECRYFVLDPQHDPAARPALEAYAANTWTDPLQRDLRAWLLRLGRQPAPSSIPARRLSGEHVGQGVVLPDGTEGRLRLLEASEETVVLHYTIDDDTPRATYVDLGPDDVVTFVPETGGA